LRGREVYDEKEGLVIACVCVDLHVTCRLYT